MSDTPRRLIGFFTVDGEDLGTVSGDNTTELLASIVGKLIERGGALGDDLISAGDPDEQFTAVLGAARPSAEDVWLHSSAAAITGLLGATTPAGIVRGDGEQIRQLVGAAAQIADRAVREHRLHWPEDEAS